MMKNTSRLMAVCALSALALSASAQKKTLAVSAIESTPTLRSALTLDGKQESLRRVVESFDSQLTASINATRKFTLVARSDLKHVLAEQELGQSGNVNAESAAQAGNLSGADYVLVVTIDDFEDSTEKMEFATLNKVGIKRKLRIGVVGKIIDSTTGKLLESVVVKSEKNDSRSESKELASNAESSDVLLVEIVEDTATKLATRVADVVFPVRVLVKRGKQVTINRGEGGGVEVGQVWDAFALGEELIDPDTGESLGSEEVKVGSVKIDRVNPKTSTAEVMDDTGIDKGAVLRPAQP